MLSYLVCLSVCLSAGSLPISFAHLNAPLPVPATVTDSAQTSAPTQATATAAAVAGAAGTTVSGTKGPGVMALSAADVLDLVKIVQGTSHGVSKMVEMFAASYAICCCRCYCYFYCYCLLLLLLLLVHCAGQCCASLFPYLLISRALVFFACGLW